MDVSNQAGRFSMIRVLKQTKSSLMNENQAIYKFTYTLEDKADDSNIVFFDSNSRKFRTRSSRKNLMPKNIKDTYNKITALKAGQNDKKYANARNFDSTGRNKANNIINKGYNNEKKGLNTENISNKINSVKINEKNLKNSQTREAIIKQLKKEKEELVGKSDSARKNQKYQNSNNKNINPPTNQKNILKNTQKDLSDQAKAKYISQKPNTNLLNKSANIIQQTPSKNSQVYSSNEKLYSNIQKSNPKTQNNYNNPSTNKKMNSHEDQNKNQKIETAQRTEERTLILVPGQTIERKSMVENFDNPTEELIENPDGTISSILKQTKVTTITENIPIEGNKIKSIEGAPELPMYKQKMTHIYKTITSINQKPNQNNYINTNVNSDANARVNNSNKDIDQKSNKEQNFGNKNGQDGDKKGKIDLEKEKEEKDKQFDSNILPKEFKNQKDLEEFLDNLNKKGENISQKEKEKRFNCIKDIFNNIAKGKSSEDNIENLAQLLANMSEKDRKEILEKLGKDAKNINLLKKVEKLIENSEQDYNKDFTTSQKYDSNLKNLQGEYAKVKDISSLKFDGLVLEISKYEKGREEKNPFEGPSPYIEVYKERRSKIKQKLENLTFGALDQNDVKQEEKK